MKVSIGMNLQQGPWGGGNQFGTSLVEYLSKQGIETYFDLNTPDLDVILLVEPRSYLKSSAFDHIDIHKYLQYINSKAVVIHRINECDERKGTNHVNRLLIEANDACADYTVFVASWLYDLLLAQGLPRKPYRVILNGANQAIFNAQDYQLWDGKSPLKLVTHHWGGHWLKGFDIYQRLDQLLSSSHFRQQYAFTYIGNLPPNFNFKYVNYVKPATGHQLASLLRQHHVYLTASVNEPGGNHQNEGALCGLPLLYRQSGCMPEYCGGYGVSFSAEDFEDKLQEMRSHYFHWTKRVKDYPHTAEKMCQAYHALFVELLDHRDKIVAQRSKQKQPHLLLQTAIPKGVRSLWQRANKRWHG